MKILKYAEPTYGDEVTIRLLDGKEVILKVGDTVDVTDADAEGLRDLAGFEVAVAKPTKTVTKVVADVIKEI